MRLIMEELNIWLVGGGLIVGAIFGLLIQRHRFCMVAATGNFLLIKDNRQLLAFVAALLVAITGTQLLEFTDTVAIACATSTLVKSAEGRLHSIIALLFFMLLAASAQFGFLETSRLSITNSTAVDLTGDASIAAILGLPQWLPAFVVVIAMTFYLYKNWNPDAKGMIIAGMAIGALVIVGWYITGVLAQDEFDPSKPSAITVSGPLARFGYILLSAKIPALSFAISFVIGIMLAVLIFSLIMTGVSTLSLESILAFSGMFIGTAITVKWMEKNS